MFRIPSTLCCLVLSLTLCSCAEEDEPATDTEANGSSETRVGKEPTPEDVLQQVADFYKTVKTVRVRSETRNEMKTDGRVGHSQTGESDVVAERPNRISLEARPQFSQVTFRSDGTTLAVFLAATGRYVVSPAPSTFDQLSRDNQLFMMLNANTVPMPVQLLSTNPRASILSGVTSSTYMGKKQMQGGTVHHLKFQQTPETGVANLEWELWVAAEGDPVVKQFRRSMSFLRGREMTAVMTETYHDWEFNQPVPAATFTFTPPEGAERVDDLFAAARGNQPGNRANEPEPEPIPSSGNPLIDFFRTFDGNVKSTTRSGQPASNGVDDENKPPDK